MQFCSLGWEDPLKEDMAAHSSILAWRMSWTEEPGGLQSMRSQRVGHDLRDLAHMNGNFWKGTIGDHGQIVETWLGFSFSPNPDLDLLSVSVKQIPFYMLSLKEIIRIIYPPFIFPLPYNWSSSAYKEFSNSGPLIHSFCCIWEGRPWGKNNKPHFINFHISHCSEIMITAYQIKLLQCNLLFESSQGVHSITTSAPYQSAPIDNSYSIIRESNGLADNIVASMSSFLLARLHEAKLWEF